MSPVSDLSKWFLECRLIPTIALQEIGLSEPFPKYANCHKHSPAKAAQRPPSYDIRASMRTYAKKILRKFSITEISSLFKSHVTIERQIVAKIEHAFTAIIA